MSISEFDAFRELKSQHVEASLLILGEGPEEEEIRGLSQGLPDVHFIGFVQPVDLPPWYAIADAFVFPTLGDPNGLVVEEAMAAGLPVISTSNAGDIRSRVIEGQTGFVVPPFDSRALAAKMHILSQNEALRKQMGEAASNLADRYSVDHYANDFDDFVFGVLGAAARHNLAATAAQLVGRGLLSAARPLTGQKCE